MLRLIAKIYIQREFDYGIACPQWVQQRLTWDKNLSTYRRQLAGLQNKLSSQASDVLNEVPPSASMRLASKIKQSSTSTTIRNQGGYSLNRSQITRLSVAVACLILAILCVEVSFKNTGVDSRQGTVNLPNESSNLRKQDDQMVQLAIHRAEKFVDQVESLRKQNYQNAVPLGRMLAQFQKTLPSGSEINDWNTKSITGLKNCVADAGRSTGLFFNQVGSGLRGTQSDLTTQLESSANSIGKFLSGWTKSLGESVTTKP